MNYLTSGELSRLLNLIDFLNAQDEAHKEAVGFEVKAYDTNGESLGTVKFSEATYAFFPEVDDA